MNDSLPQGAVSDGVVQCPHQSFAPFGREFTDDPYSLFEHARRTEPVFWSEQAQLWVVTLYDDVKRVLSDTEHFGSSGALEPWRPFTPEIQAILAARGDAPTRGMSESDGPYHTRLRRAAAKGFTPRRLRVIEDQIRAIVNEYLDALNGRTRIDIVSDFADPLPLRVMFILLGLPLSQLQTVLDGTEDRMHLMWEWPELDEQTALVQNLGNFYEYTLGAVRARMVSPEDDFTSDLVRAQTDDDSPLTSDEIATIVWGVMFGGHVTTTGLITNGVLRLCERPDVWQQITADAATIPRIVEEVLRHDGTVKTLRRTVRHDVEFGGHLMRAGSTVLIAPSSANRDDDHFDDAASFDSGRPNAKEHLTFGVGSHFCLGAPLARIEMRIIFEQLAERFQTVRLVPDQVLDYRRNPGFRLLRRLEVDLVPRTTPAGAGLASSEPSLG